jgi:hypothetical protein
VPSLARDAASDHIILAVLCLCDRHSIPASCTYGVCNNMQNDITNVQEPWVTSYAGSYRTLTLISDMHPHCLLQNKLYQTRGVGSWFVMHHTINNKMLGIGDSYQTRTSYFLLLGRSKALMQRQARSDLEADCARPSRTTNATATVPRASFREIISVLARLSLSKDGWISNSFHPKFFPSAANGFSAAPIFMCARAWPRFRCCEHLTTEPTKPRGTRFVMHAQTTHTSPNSLFLPPNRCFRLSERQLMHSISVPWTRGLSTFTRICMYQDVPVHVLLAMAAAIDELQPKCRCN